MPDNPKHRVFIRFLSDDIPGDRQRRHMTLAKSFYLEEIQRTFDEELDYVHVPCNIDSTGEKCWLLIDFNVGDEPVNLEQILSSCYRAKPTQEGQLLYSRPLRIRFLVLILADTFKECIIIALGPCIWVGIGGRRSRS